MPTDFEILSSIAQAIYDKKGANILVLNLKQIPSYYEFVIIAEGNVERHLKTLSDEIDHRMVKKGVQLLRSDAASGANWIVMDYGSIAIHLLTPNMRENYALEELWHEGKIVDVKIDTR